MGTGDCLAPLPLPADLRRRRLRIIVPSFPAFNIYSSIARITTALGPVSVATVVNKMTGWDAEVIDENNYRRHGPVDGTGRPDYDVLQKLRPADVIGLYGGLTSTIPRLHELAARFRREGIPVIAGGQHFTGDNIRDAIDHGVGTIVLGEGEITAQELLAALVAGRDPAGIPGVAFLRDGRVVQTPSRAPVTEFAQLPCPDFSLVRHARISLFPIGWVRGCGMNCEFCTVKGKVRFPTPEHAIDQIVTHFERHNARHFFIVDDLFGQRREDAIRFCRMLRDYQRTTRVRFDITVQIRLDKSKDTELLHAMREAGIHMLAIGFESPIPEELAAMNKKVKPEDMVAMARVYHKAGFLVHGMFIFGYPVLPGVDFSMSADERVRRFRKFIKQARIDTVQILLPVPLPGTEMTERLARENRIFPRDEIGWEYYDGNFPLFVPDAPLRPEDMQASSHLIMGRFYRFKYMFAIGIRVLVFPAILFSLHNIKSGWRQWYRHWRNNLWRFGGWLILRKWTSEFKKGDFSGKLARAKGHVGKADAPGTTPSLSAGIPTRP
ncbi:MAG: radical SAM protein [Planctomycetota bacterium]